MTELHEALVEYDGIARRLKSAQKVRDAAAAAFLAVMDELMAEVPALKQADEARTEAERNLARLTAEEKRTKDIIKRMAPGLDKLPDVPVITRSSQIQGRGYDEDTALAWLKERRNIKEIWAHKLLVPDRKAIIAAKVEGCADSG